MPEYVFYNPTTIEQIFRISSKLRISELVILIPQKSNLNSKGQISTKFQNNLSPGLKNEMIPSLDSLFKIYGLKYSLKTFYSKPISSIDNIVLSYKSYLKSEVTNSVIVAESFTDYKELIINQSICQKMKKEGNNYVISLNLILSSTNKIAILNILSKNIRICKKYKVTVSYSSFSDNSNFLRADKDKSCLNNTLEKRSR